MEEWKSGRVEDGSLRQAVADFSRSEKAKFPRVKVSHHPLTLPSFQSSTLPFPKTFVTFAAFCSKSPFAIFCNLCGLLYSEKPQAVVAGRRNFEPVDQVAEVVA
jgi:hypothetical protein